MRKHALLLLLLLAFALRLYRLDVQSLWWDEGISLHLATSSLADIVADRAANLHPPLYFVLLKGWVALTGTTAFSARYASLLASLLQVAALYALVRRWLGRPTAAVAGLLIALSPLAVVYAQEVRVYALLPLVYLALLALVHELVHSASPAPRRLWLLLGLTEAVGLYLHYMTLFLIAYGGGWSLLVLGRQRRRTDLRRWGITHLLVGLAGLPWLGAILLHWPAVQARLQIGRGLTEPIPLDYLLRQVWTFHLTGLAGAVGRPELQGLAGLTLLLLLALTLLRVAHPATRRTTLRLAAHWLLPLSSALIVWRLRPFAHPRYVALFAPGLILLAAGVIRPPGPPLRLPRRTPLPRPALASLLAGATTASLILISLVGLRAYFFDPAFAKDDVRGVARYLEAVAGPDDLILVPDSDWSLPFTYRGEATVAMPPLADRERMWALLARWTADRRRVFVLDYRRGTRDWQGVIPFALERAGAMVARQEFDDLFVRVYHLDRPVAPPTPAPIEARFGPLLLTRSWVEAEAPADTALTLALGWRLAEATDQRYRLALRLLDADGWPLAAADAPLLDEGGRPTDRWPAGREVTTYHLLPLPPGTPPLTYTLALGLYALTADGPRPLDLLDAQGAPQGQQLALTTVRLTAPLGLTDNPYRVEGGPPPLAEPVPMADGLRLLGAALDRTTLAPGQPLFVTLRWRATRAPLPDLRPRLALVQAGRELSADAAAPALGRYPTDRWQAGETVVEHRRLTVPPEAASGPAEVVLSLNGHRLVLGQVEVRVGERLLTPPPIAHPMEVRFGSVARLLGYDLPDRPIRAGEPLTLTLYWEALEGATGTHYTVFTHLLAPDGRIVAQHDGVPAGGRKPTGGWLPGEIIVDPHPMAFREPGYRGPARIEVGLYNPTTGERLVTDRGEDFVYLPGELEVGR